MPTRRPKAKRAHKPPAPPAALDDDGYDEPGEDIFEHDQQQGETDDPITTLKLGKNQPTREVKPDASRGNR